jgi:signal transduction histidine kinase
MGFMDQRRKRGVREARNSIKFRTRLAVVFSASALSVAALLVLVLYLNFRTQLREDFRERLHDIVATAALTLDGDAHATLIDPSQEGNPTYMQFKRRLQQIRDSSADIRFAYTWRRGPDGRLAFVVDGETDPNEVSHLGDVYDSAEPAVLAKLATLNSVLVDDEPAADQWGVWLSGYAPFYRSDGQMEGILGMDINVVDVRAHEHRFLWVGLAVLVASIPVVLVLGFSFGRSLAAPIVELTRGAERIAGGDLTYRVSVKGRDEAYLLAQSFNRMTDTLCETIAYRDAEIEGRKKAESIMQMLNTDLETSVQRLSHANEELRSFAFITSHDLKTPLRGMRMLADWIATDYMSKLDAQGQQFLALLARRATRMYNFVEAIHHYTGVGCEETKRPIDLNELVRDIIRRLAVPTTVEIAVDGPLPVVEGNEHRLGQVFGHLLGNAVKYLDKPQGRISVRCVVEAAQWKFSVADNGPGIEQKYYQKVFEVFQTLATKDESESTGMGLSIVKKIVEFYGGTIWIESVVGEGTTFFFTLPRPTAVPTESKLLPGESADAGS